ncbi:MAG: hypothetical protein ACMUIP_05310 [bacterium]
MARILKPITIYDPAKLSTICSQFLIDEYGLRIIDSTIDYNDIVKIDVLAVCEREIAPRVIDSKKIYLITIDSSDFNEALIRAFSGYKWFMDNKVLLHRIYSSADIDLERSPSLLIVSPNAPSETYVILKDVCKVPLNYLKFTLFGSESDPDIFIEDFVIKDEADDSHNQSHRENYSELHSDTLRKELNIEFSNLTDEEIKEFLQSI